MSTRGGILGCIRRAVIEPTDSPELRLKKTFLVFATALISAAALLWLAIYWQLGPQVSATIPIFFLLLLWGNFAVYLKTRNLAHFQNIQLSLILIMPFVAQWRMGSFVSASGISLWSLLAPIGATLLIGIRESTRWFIAYIALTALSGAFEFFSRTPAIPHATSFPHKQRRSFSPSISRPCLRLFSFCSGTRRWKYKKHRHGKKRPTSACKSNRIAPNACCSTSCQHQFPLA